MQGYIRDTWDCGDSLEIEEKHTGRYGARGQKRQERKEPTPEDIARQNQWRKERDIRRLIKWNFSEKDYWITITYRKGDRPPWQEMKKDMDKLIRNTRIKYKEQGWELKYIYRLAIGKRGGPHIHILVNRESNEKTGTDLILSKLWKKGHVNIAHLYEDGGYKALAEYIAKPLESWEPPSLKQYHPSRNLIRKEPKRKQIKRRSLIDSKAQFVYPKAPKGWYVDHDSVRMGINPITGYAYRHYTLIKNRRKNE